MTSRLTEEELDEIESRFFDDVEKQRAVWSDDASFRTTYRAQRFRDTQRLIDELRSLRARLAELELSEQDLEAFRWLRFLLGKHHHEPYAYEGEELDHALAVLDRLTGAKP